MIVKCAFRCLVFRTTHEAKNRDFSYFLCGSKFEAKFDAFFSHFLPPLASSQLRRWKYAVQHTYKVERCIVSPSKLVLLKYDEAFPSQQNATNAGFNKQLCRLSQRLQD